MSSTPKSSRRPSMKRLTSGRVGSSSFREKHAGGLEDLFRLAQLAHLTLERLHPLALVAGQAIAAAAGIRFELAHRLAQRLVMDAQIGRYMRDRPTALEH